MHSLLASSDEQHGLLKPAERQLTHKHMLRDVRTSVAEISLHRATV